MKRIILIAGIMGIITAAHAQTNTNSNTNPQQNYSPTTPLPVNVKSAQPQITTHTTSGTTLVGDTTNKRGTSYPNSHTRNTQRTNANSINPNTTPNTTPPGNNGTLNNGTNTTTPGQVH